jgi:MFS family permease
MYVVAVVFIALMPHTGKVVASGRSVLADIIEGFQYVRRQRTILLLLAFILLVILLSRPYMVLLPIFTEDILGVGETGLGIMLSVSGVGAMIGSVTLASLPNKKRGLMLLVGCIVLGGALIGFSFSDSWPLSLGLMVVVGLGQTARMTLGNTLVQYYVADEYRGRVMSIYTMDFGLTSLGTFGAALIADAVGAPWAVGGFAIALVFVALVAFVFLPRLRRLD